MASFTYTLSNDLINHITGYAAYTAPTLYIGLSTTTPTVAGTNVTEPSTSGTGYARQAITGSTTWGAAASGSAANAVAVSFSTATATWSSGANMTYSVLFDSAASGNFLAFGAIAVPQPVVNGNTPSFPIGAVTITFS